MRCDLRPRDPAPPACASLEAAAGAVADGWVLALLWLPRRGNGARAEPAGGAIRGSGIGLPPPDMPPREMARDIARETAAGPKAGPGAAPQNHVHAPAPSVRPPAAAGQPADRPRQPAAGPACARVRLLLLDTAGGSREVLMPKAGRLSGRRLSTSILFTGPATQVRLDLFAASPTARPLLWLVRLPRALAAVALLASRLPQLPARLAGPWRGLPGRLRAALAHAEPSAADPADYRDWVSLFDQWSDADRAALWRSPRRPAWPAIHALVLAGPNDTAPDDVGQAAAGRGANEAALAATLASLAAQWLPLASPVLGLAGPDLAAMAPQGSPSHGTPSQGTPSQGMSADGIPSQGMAPNPAAPESPSWIAAPGDGYLLILQAGEVLPPHATALLADRIAAAAAPAIVVADEDALDRLGRRSDPVFKPQPSLGLILSGLATTGAWLLRSDLLAEAAAGAMPAAAQAEALRLALWLNLCDRPDPPGVLHVPFVLVHRRPDTHRCPPALLGAIAERHLRARLEDATVDATALPLRPHLAPALAREPEVAIIIPTRLASAHVFDCAASLAGTTSYGRLSLIYAVSEPDHARGRSLARRLVREFGARVIVYPGGSFNYSRVNNLAAATCQAEILCLLNDDVAPIRPEWLGEMVGWLMLPGIGAVGARLLYPGGLVQHAGMVLGVGGVCSHINRFLPGSAAGPQSRALADQEFSAVTGACLAVRRQVFDSVGGLDEALPVSLNDIDFCLRVRRAGWRVMLAAGAELTHFESLSLGNHYQGEREGQEAAEARLMRGRWPEAIAADPFHSPNLSRQAGHEWQPGFPPRLVRHPG